MSGDRRKTQDTHLDGEGLLVEFVLSLNLHRRHLTSSQRAVLSSDVVKELELEAKERQQMSPGSPKKHPQTFAEIFESDDLEPSHPERRRVDSSPEPAKATTHTRTTKLAEKKNKGDGEAREQAAKLLGTNHDYISKNKKLEGMQHSGWLQGKLRGLRGRAVISTLEGWDGGLV